MSNNSDHASQPPSLGWPLDFWQEAASYTVDAWQRGILFLDVLRQRGNQYQEHMAKQAPNVLSFSVELVLDGRTLPRPVNYGLVRITPPSGVEVDPLKRPFVIVDPRAGHGPGIGGFKADSEIGVALRAGHACYFIGFLPHPMPGQTIEDVVEAEAKFIARVSALHPEAEGKPVVVGNCQAGWQTMMTAATHPELFGPIIIAGAPLSYWAGERGRNPMRYSGGLLGGTWMTALSGDIGGGKFDGVWLVENFEGLNPSNTLWAKQYNLYSKVDTEAPRYLEFERWWGGHVLLNAEEMQYIADNLFVGNRLSTAGIVTAKGERIDLRNIRSPIIVFCSKGDNITPPQQALGWITDLYESVDDIRAHGQTIVYTIHDHIGHLGIFVSAGVARKEHNEFASNIDFIDVLPPGLYEAEIIPKAAGEANAGYIQGDYLLRFHARDIDDIKAIVHNDPSDDRRFATAEALSRVNLGLYRSLMQPFVRGLVTPSVAEWLERLHPLRLQYEIMSDRNPLMQLLASTAELVRENRAPVAAGNPFHVQEAAVSTAIEGALDQYRDLRDATVEQLFLRVYGSPLLQGMLGVAGADGPPRPRPGEEPEHRAFVAQRQAELRSGIAEGGATAAALRALIYVGQVSRVADERSFNLLRTMRSRDYHQMSLDAFKALLREQSLMLHLDPKGALAALPAMLDGAPAEEIENRAEQLRQLATVAGALTGEAEERFKAVEAIFSKAAAKARQGASPAEATEEAAEIADSAPDLATIGTTSDRKKRRTGVTLQ